MVATAKVCTCGRSLTGFCEGMHTLTNEEYIAKLQEVAKQNLTEKVLLNESK